MTRLLSIVLAVFALLGAGCAKPAPFELTVLGSTASSDGLAISAGGRVAGSELAVDLHFGTLDGGDGPRLSYLVLLRPVATLPTEVEINEHTSCDGRRAQGELSLRRRDGNSLDLRVAAERPEEGEGLVETLEVNGKAFDVTAGRVLLVDLAGPAPDVRQLDLPLPALQGPWEPVSVRAAVLATLADLTAASDAVRDFVD